MVSQKRMISNSFKTSNNTNMFKFVFCKILLALSCLGITAQEKKIFGEDLNCTSLLDKERKLLIAGSAPQDIIQSLYILPHQKSAWKITKIIVDLKKSVLSDTKYAAYITDGGIGDNYVIMNVVGENAINLEYTVYVYGLNSRSDCFRFNYFNKPFALNYITTMEQIIGEDFKCAYLFNKDKRELIYDSRQEIIQSLFVLSAQNNSLMVSKIVVDIKKPVLLDSTYSVEVTDGGYGLNYATINIAAYNSSRLEYTAYIYGLNYRGTCFASNYINKTAEEVFWPKDE